MYKYPKEIQFGGHVCSIELTEGVSTRLGDPVDGDSHFHTSRIRIATGTMTGGRKSLSYLTETLYHEFVEHINTAWVIGLTEDQVEQLAQGLLQVLNQLGVKPIEEV